MRTEVSKAIVGEIDRAWGKSISGWVKNEAFPLEHLIVSYTEPNGNVVRATANLPRSEHSSGQPISSNCCFELILTQSISPRARAIEVFVEGHDVVLEGRVDWLSAVHDVVCLPNPEASAEAIGAIDSTANGLIEGWLFSPDPAAVPMVKVGGRWAEPLRVGQPRPDVNAVLGITGDTGFAFSIGWMRPEDLVELYVLTMGGLTLVGTRHAGSAKLDESFLSQLSRVAAIAGEEGSVAVVCWDAAHNPVGRAKVLFDIVRTHRPAALISYVFEEFGGRIWSPLQSLDIPILAIPWAHRAMYEQALELAGVRFNTVWLCKPRLPTFLLAKAVAAPDAQLILDHDDNEEHFSRSAGSKDKPYGLSAINLARALAANIPARTAASGSLCQEFDAFLVRHAREQQKSVGQVGHGPFKVGFIGTVRAHKNALDAAKAVRLFRLTTGIPVEYHVYGDVHPSGLVDELELNGAVVVQGVPMAELYARLAGMDVVLTGYPSATDHEITKYQISSKIGDALAVGKPVLVPNGPSVGDLAGTAGVFLFDETNFVEQLQTALMCDEPLCLPYEFTLKGAYQAFLNAENRARTAAKGKDALALIPASAGRMEAEPTLLLIWKQPDAGFYGRRVDQVARAYKRANPDSRVVILELVHQTTIDQFEANSRNRLSDHGALLRLSHRKRAEGIEDDGVHLRQLVYSSSGKLANMLESFLVDQGMLPCNTKIVAFPIIPFFEKILAVISGFRLIVDIVDNQISWPAKDPVKTKLLQYVSFCNSADVVVFNSECNRAYFEKMRSVLPDERPVVVIPNWYTAPQLVNDREHSKPSGHHLLYSGNMHDRIDWSLMTKISGFGNEFTLHLVGSASTKNIQFEYLLSRPNVIYHGPLAERQTLSLLSMIDVAIMPHEVDEISTYMNPLKVHMYAACGVPTVATTVPGLAPSDWLHIAADHDEFLRLAKLLAHQGCSSGSASDASHSARAYVDLIDACGGFRQDLGDRADPHNSLLPLNELLECA